jgi:hypothetical protein
MQMIGSFLGSIAEIAAGNIAAAADALENGLARGLKLVISFLAKFLHLDGITAKIREVLDKVRGKVEAVLDKVAGWVVGMAKKAGKLVGTAAGKLLDWWKAKKKFHSADGEDHEVGFEGEDGSAELVVYSSPQRMAAYFSAWSTGIGAIIDDTAKAQQQKALSDAKAKYAIVKALQNELSARAVKGADDPVRQKKADQLTAELSTLAALLALHDLGPATPRPPAVFPPFVNGVLASTFKASYLTKSVVGTGTEPSESNQPKSWDVVRANKLSDRAGWVRMHLLTAQLGGKAADSNLVPAHGTQTNIVFRDAVEHPARDALLGKGGRKESMIWYAVNVQFHPKSATHGAGFPSHIGISWAGYEPKNGKWTEKPEAGKKTQSPSLPVLSASSAVLMINLEGRSRVGSVLGISELYSRRIVEMRDEKGRFETPDDLIARVKAYNPGLASVIASKAKDPTLVSFSEHP